jgi:diaminopimelate decarboxylase
MTGAPPATDAALAPAALAPAAASAAVLRAARTLPSPALIYDARAIAGTVARLREDLAAIPDARLCFAVKANRCPPLLRHLAALGLGADVASLPELDAARNAGMRPVYATAPSLSAAELRALADGGALPDIDSLSQLRQLVAAGGPGNAAIGLRVRTPVSPSDRERPERPERTERPGQGPLWSRFGVNPADPELHRLLSAHRLRVTRLHAHTGELSSPARAVSLVRLLLSCLRLFPHVDTLNIGGGLTLLYADQARARRAWTAVGRAIEEHRSAHGGRAPALVVEPGMLVTALSGYLVVTIRAAGRHPGGHRLATADASGWSLLDWAAPRVVGTHPPRGEEPAEPHDIAGASCYENDYLLRSVKLPPLRVGDRLVLSSAGAYVSSMARAMHGFPVPAEWVLHGEEVVGVDGARIRLPERG